jgi:hypothetical protein
MSPYTFEGKTLQAEKAGEFREKARLFPGPLCWMHEMSIIMGAFHADARPAGAGKLLHKTDF